MKDNAEFCILYLHADEDAEFFKSPHNFAKICVTTNFAKSYGTIKLQVFLAGKSAVRMQCRFGFSLSRGAYTGHSRLIYKNSCKIELKDLVNR